MASSRSAVCTAPADYADLFIEYGDDVRRVVWQQLGTVARPADVDDGVQYIMAQLMPRPAEGSRPAKRGVIAEYEPGTVSDFNHKPVTFKAFLMAKVALYCRGLRESLGRRAGRELLLVDTRGGEDGAVPWLDLLGGTLDEYPSLADGDAAGRLRDALAAREPAAGGESVLPLFDALTEQFATGRTVSAAAVRKKLGKSPEEADAWMAELRDALRGVTAPRPHPVPDFTPAPIAFPDDSWMDELRDLASGEPEFKLGGLRLSAAEVRAAVSALKQPRYGNRVLPVFKDAGHRLAEAGKTWYLGFAEEVMKAHPELRVPPRRHSEGHFGRVKQALIFGLEQLVAGLPEDAPVDGPVGEAVAVPVAEMSSAALWADLESVLTRVPGLAGERVEAAMEAVRLLAAT